MKPHAKTALSLALAIVGGIAAGLRCDASAQGNAAAEAALGRTLEQFRNPQVRAEFEPYAQLSKSAFKNIAPFIVSMVKARLNRANVRGLNLDVSAVTQLTVSVAGFMSGSVKSIEERLGGKAYHTFHRGGANNIA